MSVAGRVAWVIITKRACKEAIFVIITEAHMGSFHKHLAIAREKMASVNEAYGKKRYTVVGDLATKVVEQIVEADAATASRHFGTHKGEARVLQQELSPGDKPGDAEDMVRLRGPRL